MRWAPPLALAFCCLLGSCLGPGLEPPSRQGVGDGSFGNDGATGVAADGDLNRDGVAGDGDALDDADQGSEAPTPGSPPAADIDADAGMDDDAGVE